MAITGSMRSNIRTAHAAASFSSIVWDDEAGTVRGDHQYVSDLQQGFKDKLIAVVGAVTVLEDPAHNAREFLALIAAAATESSYLDPRSVLRVQLIPSTDIRGSGGSGGRKRSGGGGGLRWARGVGYVLTVPATNRPVLRGGTFMPYFQVVTNPEL